MKSYKVILSSLAQQDLDDIYRNLAESTLSKQTASKYVSKIYKAISSLMYLPEGRPRYTAYKTAHEFRFISVGSYVALFTVDNVRSIVYIYRVVYGRRDLTQVF